MDFFGDYAEREKIFVEFVENLGYTIIDEPYTTNLLPNKNGVLTSLGESWTFLFASKDDTTHHFSLSMLSKKAYRNRDRDTGKYDEVYDYSEYAKKTQSEFGKYFDEKYKEIEQRML